MANSSKTNKQFYNLLKEKRVLQEEEKTLKDMLLKFQDQLNRLKVEELALLSRMKMEAEKGERSTLGYKGREKNERTTARSLDSISEIGSNISPAVLVEAVHSINQEEVHLDVDFQHKTSDHRMQDFEEEEEEEEDDEMTAEDYAKQLRSYMDSV